MSTSNLVFEFNKSTLCQALKQGAFVDIEILQDSTRYFLFELGLYKVCSIQIGFLEATQS